MTLLANAYKISRRIAVGDLAEVMLAAQHGFGGLEKLVVLKRLLPHVRADAHFVQVFVEAVRNAARLKHQAIAEIYDIVHDESDLCVVMEYLSGEDLAFLTRAQSKGELKVPVPIACRIIAQAAEGLHFAHTVTDEQGRPLGMLHGDLAPGNVVVTFSGVTKVADLGVYRADIQNIYARPNTVKLKMAYRSPERLQHREIDERTDVYSLGVLLYELLVGRRLFRGDNESSVLKNVMELEVPAPSTLNTEVSADLDQIVLHAIARDPDNRTASAHDLRQGLETVLASNKKFVGEHEVHAWMTSGLKARFAERQMMERAVMAETRDVSRAPSTTAELPPMFGGFSGSEITVTPSATSVSTMVGRAASKMPMLGLPQQRRSRTLLLSLLASLITLIIVMIFAFAYWLGSTRTPEMEPGGATGQIAPGSPASLLVHSSPGGARLLVGDKTLSEDVGVEGVLVPVAPNATVKLVLRKNGFLDEVLEVRSPSTGTKHVYVNLSKGEDGVGVTTDASEPTAAASEAGRSASGPTPSESVSRKSSGRVGTAGTRAKRGRAAPRSGDRTRAPPARRRGKRRRPGRQQVRPSGTTLVVSFAPPFGTLSVDGIVRSGRSPVRVSGLTAGPHRVIVSAPGFETRVEMVELGKDVLERAVRINLPRKAATALVGVTSAPTGASVKVDGKAQGKTPLEGLRLPAARTYEIRVELPGYRRWSTRLKVDPDTNNKIQAKLVKLD